MIKKKQKVWGNASLLASAILIALATGSANAAPNSSSQMQPVDNQDPGSFYNQSTPTVPTGSGLYQAQPQQNNNAGNNVPARGNAMPIGNVGENVSTPNSNPQNLPPLPNSAMPTQSDFDVVRNNMLGVSPNEIRQLHKAVDDRAKAVSEDPNGAPTPKTGSISVSLSPGSTPSIIRTYVNHTTSFVVVDRTGQPWPVENFRVGNKDAFTVSRLDASSPDGSSFTIDAGSAYARSNMILKLKGTATPVVIDLVAGQKSFDERVEVRVGGRGPNATAPTSEGLPSGADSRLMPVLDGIAPQGGKRVKVTGDESTRAWIARGKLVVRTPLKIISPASFAFMSSSDGTNVYVFNPVTQLVGLQDGNVVNLSVQDW